MDLAVGDLVVGLGFMLFFEGLLYALFPDLAKRMMDQALRMPEQMFRFGGLIFATIGVIIIYLVRY